MIFELQKLLKLKEVSRLFIISTFMISILAIIEIVSIFPLGLLIKFYLKIPLGEIENKIIYIFDQDLILESLIVTSALSIFCSAIASFLTAFLHSNLIWTATHRLALLKFQSGLLDGDPFDLKHDVAVIRKDITTEVQQYAYYGIGSLSNIIGRSITFVIIAIGLIIFAPKNLVISFAIIIIAFTIIIYLISKRTKAIGVLREYYASQIFKDIEQVSNSLPMIKGFKNRHFFETKFEDSSLNFKRAANAFMILPQLPRICIDLLFYLTVITLIYFSTVGIINMTEAAIYSILAVLKFIPSANLLFRSISERAYARKSFSIISPLFDQMKVESVQKTRKINFDSFDIKINILSKGSDLKKVIPLNSINMGEIIVFEGKSGSGKSTILQVLSGISERDFLKINVFDAAHSKINFETIPIGYLPQSVALINGNLEQNINFGEHKSDRDIPSILKEVGLVHLIDKLEHSIFNLANNFSGGEIQRIGLARLIYQDPEIIFLDEPTSALDTKNEELIYNILKAFSKMGKLTFLATHSARLKSLASRKVNLERMIT